MTQALYLAAASAAVLAVAHSVLGERYILVRLFRRNSLPKLFGSDLFTRRTLRFAWHITTVAWFGFAVLLMHLADDQLTRSVALRTIGWTFVASGVLPLIITRGRHLSWVVLFAIGGVAFSAV